MKPTPEAPTATTTPVTTFPPDYPGAHPIADTYPLTEEDVAQMMADMKQRQKRRMDPQANTIQMLADGRIIDGRTRWIACARLGLTPRVNKLGAGTTDEVLQSFVRSLNDVRRNSAPAGMKAMLVLDLVQESLAERGGQPKAHQKGIRTVRIQDAAKQAGVSSRSMEQAVLIKKHGSKELQEEVKAGKVSLKQAEKRVRPPKAPPTPEPAPEATPEAIEDLPPVYYQALQQGVNLLPPYFQELLRRVLEDMTPGQQGQVAAFLPTALARASAPTAREATKACLDLLQLQADPSDGLQNVQRILRWYQHQPECQAAAAPEAPAAAAE